MRSMSIGLLYGCLLLVCSGLLQTSFALAGNEEAQAPAESDQDAFDYFKALADKGDPVGQFYLGAMYAEGRGVMRHHKMAVALYSKAAQQNYAPAQFSLGMAYANALGVSRDYAKAAKWWERASKQDHAEAQYNLAGLYYYGLGVRQNQHQAQKLFMSSADLGHGPAQRALSIFAALEHSVEVPIPFPAPAEQPPTESMTTTE